MVTALAAWAIAAALLVYGRRRPAGHPVGVDQFDVVAVALLLFGALVGAMTAMGAA